MFHISCGERNAAHVRRIGAAVIPVCLLVDLPPGSAVRPAELPVRTRQVTVQDGMVHVIPSSVPASSPAPVAP